MTVKLVEPIEKLGPWTVKVDVTIKLVEIVIDAPAPFNCAMSALMPLDALTLNNVVVEAATALNRVVTVERSISPGGMAPTTCAAGIPVKCEASPKKALPVMDEPLMIFPAGPEILSEPAVKE